MSRATKFIGTTAICGALFIASGPAAFSQDAGRSNAQNCKAPPVQQSPDGKNATKESDITGSTTLSDCGGVINPPETGDSTLVQPAPPASNMPVVRPNDLPAQQQNAK